MLIVLLFGLCCTCALTKQAIVTRKNSLSRVKYSDEPAIFAWELINEPRCLSNSSAPVFQVNDQT